MFAKSATSEKGATIDLANYVAKKAQQNGSDINDIRMYAIEKKD